jgi:hypothetical protein
MFLVEVLAGVVLGVALLLWWAHRRRAVLKTTFVTIPLAAVIWLLDLAWIESDPTGAGGAFDCWPGCTFGQEIARIGFVVPPLYAAALLVAVALHAAIGLVVRQRHRPPGH